MAMEWRLFSGGGNADGIAGAAQVPDTNAAVPTALLSQPSGPWTVERYSIQGPRHHCLGLYGLGRG